MATNEELKEAVKLAKELDRLRVKLGKEPLKLTNEQAIKQFKDLPRDIELATRELSNMEGTASNLYDNLRAISSEFKGQPTIIKKTRSAFRELEKSAQNLKLDELSILDLNRRQAQALADKAKRNQAILKQEGSSLITSNSFLKNLEIEIRNKKNLGMSNDRINDTVSERLQKAENLSEEEKALLQTYFDQNDPLGKIIAKADERVELEKKISKQMGVTGALVGGTGALMERLGMRSGIFHDAMRESSERMRDLAKNGDDAGEEVSKLRIAAEGFAIVAKGFGQALGDPAAIIGALLNSFFEVNKASVEFTRLTGKTSVSLVSAQVEASNLVDIMNTAADITKQTGLNAAAIFSPAQLGQLSDAKNLLGISGEQAANLGMMMKLTGESADQLGNAIYDNVDAGVSQKMVYDDVLSASQDIVASAGGNTKELGKAASAARKLGLDLQKVNQIADGLLDFESSISSELEAQLLTGKNINLSKARELALNNDLEGVAKELEKNGASAAEYAKMNRIQQQALAQALGMSREELGKMVLSQEALANMTAEERAQARGVTLEQSKQMDIQARLAKSVSALSQAFAPILENFIVPIANTISYIVQSVAGLVGLITGATENLSTMQAVLGTILTIYGGLWTYSKGIAIYEGIILGYKALQNREGKKQLILQSKGLVKTVGEAIFNTISALSKLGPVGIILGLGAVAGLTTLAANYMDDGAIAPVSGGKAGYSRTMYGPKGSISFNDKDTIVAGTNLLGDESGGTSSVNTPRPSIDGSVINVDTKALEVKLDMLIATVKAGGNVYLDGNKVGSAQVLGTYKSS